MDVSRREFLVSGTSAAGATMLAQAVTQPALAQPATPGSKPVPVGFNPAGPALKFDLVIAGGTVLDPGQKLSGKMMPFLTVRGGRPFGRPPLPMPFTY
jgi:hypothetical protein